MRRLSLIILYLLFVAGTFAQKSPHGEGLSVDCKDCHTTDSWKMIEGNYTFNHEDTEFPLEGQHRNTDCKWCHTSMVFSKAEADCYSCHTDMHEQTLGLDCARCHSSESWIVTNMTELHQLTQFPLIGPHNTADCSDCHKSASTLRFDPLGVECFDCHQQDYMAAISPNHVLDNYSTNCIDCHRINAFSWSGAGINHNFFPLTQGHAINDCYQCHTQGVPYANISNDCFDCHQPDYTSAINPNHVASDFSTSCADCHSLAPGWKPAGFRDHDPLFFPIYSGKHNGEWNNCLDCHPSPSNYSQFTCIDCHEHNQNDMDDEHGGIGGYLYESSACLDCHPTGDDEGAFNHSASDFPLTGAHTTTQCSDCHTNGYTGTSSVCFDCHSEDYAQTSNPNHTQINLSNDCAECHTAEPEWKPATFLIHNDFYPLTGAHGREASNCFACHEGNYGNTPNTCFGCHSNDYNQASDPPHASAQFSTDCIFCHTEEAWEPSTFDHDGQYFPIYSGEHGGEWNTCAECHNNPADYSIFTCIDCHEHNQGEMNSEHNDVQGYIYNSIACLDCHPTGGEKAFRRVIRKH
ncbi:MAG: hypothetical protein JEZ03_14165 [Bacteroidales bacterium]|nr:hypothetical protein [Bacteroidales bacterium]